MRKEDVNYSVYLVTDRSWLNGRTLEEDVEKAILGGATLVQIREKGIGYAEYIKRAYSLKRVTDKYGIPLIVNDSPFVAKAVGADGVHIGQGDMPAAEVRRIVGGGMLLGVSVSSLEEALAAEKGGADYIGIGAVFPTATKADATYLKAGGLKRITQAVGIPAVAIGGINARNLQKLYGLGLAGVAVVSAILGAGDVRAAAREISRLAKGL